MTHDADITAFFWYAQRVTKEELERLKAREPADPAQAENLKKVDTDLEVTERVRDDFLERATQMGQVCERLRRIADALIIPRLAESDTS